MCGPPRGGEYPRPSQGTRVPGRLTMKLNHLDLQVSDVQRTVDFFEKYFDLELRSSRTSPALAILSDRHGFVLVLQRRKHDAETYPEGFHVGFLVDDVETVH